MMPPESRTASPADDAPARRTERLYAIATALVLLLGAYLRLNRYLLNRSLWLDEAMFARNIIERTPLQLIGSLSFGQHSPAGFTLVVKLLTMAFGAWEPVLRLMPLLAGLASLPLFYLLAKKWLPQWACLLALSLFAVSDALGEYAGQQFEKYSSDVALTLVILLVGLWFYESRHRRRYLIFGAVGIVAVWFSYPIAFVLAGIGLPMFFSATRRKDYREALLVSVMAASWLASAAAMYGISIRSELESPTRGHYWARYGGFLEFSPLTIRQAEGDIATLVRPFEYPTGFALYSGVVLLYGLGAVDALRKGGTRWFVVAPFLVTVALSAVRIYPLYARLILFLVPLLQLTVVMGIARLWEALSGRTEKWLAAGFLALILFQPLRDGLARGLNPRKLEETRPLMMQLSQSYRPGDSVVLYYAAQHAYAYYASMLDFNQVVPSVIKPHPEAPEEYCSEIKPLIDRPRVWVLFSHLSKGPQGSEESVIIACLDQHGRQLEAIQETGASLYLYDLQDQPAETPAG